MKYRGLIGFVISLLKILSIQIKDFIDIVS